MITAKDKSKKSAGKTNSSDPSKTSGERRETRSQNESGELIYPHEAETDDQTGGNDENFSERTDVTPPNKKGFPSVGPAKTDFASRPQGRTTGRMIGHEPGTEGI